MSADELKKIKLKVQIWITSVLGLFSLGIIVLEPVESALVKWAIGINWLLAQMSLSFHKLIFLLFKTQALTTF